MFDRVVSAIALIVLAPLMLAIAVWIKLASPGPILFRQVRIGKDARPFTLLKYRSMTPGADRLADNVTPRDDPRVTRVGRALRRWYLDELPQLINVLRGDMSLVGPRPETPEFVAELLPHELKLLEVRPGLVGASTLAFMHEADLLAEAEDPLTYYRTTLLHERVRCDLEYLSRQSLRTDIAVLIRQAVAILSPRTRTS
jgi:lipopolysaccharide/colanic/teichoic acid biosynthesis glycosyltransferase